MDKKTRIGKKILVGIVTLAICIMTLGGLEPASAASSQSNGKGYNKSVVKVKTKKNNKKNVNRGNSSEKSWNQKMIQTEVLEENDKVVKVAIIDSGVNYSSDINVAVRRNFIEDDECSALYEDFSDHGTAVAGIICAQNNEIGITGINPNVELYSARVLDEKLEAPIDRIISAINWAIEEKVDIINMSFGTEQDDPKLHQIIKKAYENGILLISAAGNDKMIVYPAAYEEVIAVGAIDSLGNPTQDKISGSMNEIMAPGENILSSAIFDGVVGGSGTSLAAAHITGVASLLMEKYPDMPAEFIRALMDYSANLYGDKEIFGNGVIDYEYAIDIAPSFKKAYEKYLRKSAQNEKQREKQKESFWGEIIKTIPENEKTVEVFEGIENVVGLWRGTGHDGLTDYADENANVSFTANQLAIIKAGCKYPDKSATTMEGMNANPYHGFFRLEVNGGVQESNYLANYIFLTRVAMNAGSTNGLANVSGMNQEDRNRINADFSGGMIGGMSYSDAFALMNISNLDSSSTENRKLFIYGIAMHLAGDVFAHSTWRYNEATAEAVRIKHHDYNDGKNCYSDCCDNTTWYSKRFDAAKQVMKNVIVKAYNKTEGLLQDFGISASYYGITSSNPSYDVSVEDSDSSVRYYLFYYQKYAQDVNPTLFSNWVQYNSSYYISFHSANLQSHFSANQIDPDDQF